MKLNKTRTLGRANRLRELLLVSASGLLLGSLSPADARITKIAISSTAPAYGGATFGSVGAYEFVTGTAFGEVDPSNELNKIIQDIQLAPRNARGMVEYSTKFQILKPVDESKGNHMMLFEIVNRGNELDPGFYNIGVTAANPQGDGFLENQGLTLVWAGWQADLVAPASNPGLITMVSVPVATQNGQTITGVVRSEWTVSTPISTQNILAEFSSNTPGYASVTTNNAGLTLTMRVHQDDPRTAVPNSDWAFADCTSTPFPGVPNAQKVCLKNGFDTNHIYELVYTAKDPIVMGLGLAAIRDVGSFFRRANSSAGNPIAGAISYSLLNGISQSGRLLRTYLNLGFNLGEDGQQVFDGMQPHIGAVENYINVRFSQPGRLAGTQHTEKQYPGPDSPLTYARRNDPLLGEPRGLLDRCTRTNTCPKIVHTMSDIEYWEFLRGGRHDRATRQTGPAAAAGCAHLSVLQQPTWRVLAGGASSDLDGDMPATAGCEHVHLQYPSAPGCTRRLGGAGAKAAGESVLTAQRQQPGAGRECCIPDHSRCDGATGDLQHAALLLPRSAV